MSALELTIDGKPGWAGSTAEQAEITALLLAAGDVRANIGRPFYNTDTKVTSVWNSTGWDPVEHAGAKRVTTTKAATPHNRELLAVNKASDPAAVVAADLHTTEYLEADDITEVTVVVALGATASITVNSPLDAGVYVTFTAQSDAIAAAWLSALSSGTVNSQRYFVAVGKPRTFRFTGNILRVDLVAAGNSTNNDFDVILESA